MKHAMQTAKTADFKKLTAERSGGSAANGGARNRIRLRPPPDGRSGPMGAGIRGMSVITTERGKAATMADATEPGVVPFDVVAPPTAEITINRSGVIGSPYTRVLQHGGMNQMLTMAGAVGPRRHGGAEGGRD
jgi:hypothetical protein